MAGTVVKDDFTCLEPSPLQTNSGVIKFIWKNLILALTDNNELYYLRMGACTRIESVGSTIPYVGQRIMWKGKVDDSGYNVYSASSF